MKKRIFGIMLLVICIMCVGCSHQHTWQAATCVSPKICPECGETDGEALGHDWIEATCTDAKICKICLNTMGQPLDHKWIDASCTYAKHCELCGLTEGELIDHTWRAATCTSPMMCEVCGTTEGELLEHSWNPATCTMPETCSVCGNKQGEALGHNYAVWVCEKQSTCTQAGVETSKCSVCGEKGERNMALAAHMPGQWIIKTEATPDTTGTKVIKCTKCHKELESQTYRLSDYEIKQYYENAYQSISYNNLARYPDDYEGEKVKFSGRVVQVCSEAASALYYSTYRVSVNGNYNCVVYICVDNYGTGRRILEDDWITFYGEFDGLYTYTTVMGASVTIPKIIVEHIA